MSTTGSTDIEAPRPGLSLGRTLVFWAAGAMLLGVLRWTLGLGVPLGPDPAMWGLAGEELLNGHWPTVSAGYPLLMALGSLLSGQPAWFVGGLVSLLAFAGCLPLLVSLARRSGLSPLATAWLVGAMFVVPELLEFAVQLQPDATTTLALLVGLWGGWRWAEGRPAWVWVLALVPALLLREHGPVALAAALLVMLGWRAPRLVVGLVLAGVGVGVGIVLLDAWAWLPGRVSQPLVESPLGAGTAALPSYANELGGGRGQDFARAWRLGDRLAVWGVLLGRLFARSGENLVWIGLGLLGFATLPRRRRLVAWATLAPVVPLFFIWSHRRHTAVLLPVALLGVAIGVRWLARRYAWPRGPLAVAGLLALGVLGRDTPAAMSALAGAAKHGHDRIALASWLAEQPGEWFLGGQHNEINLHLVWPRSNPELPRPGEPMPTKWPGADWRTLWVSPQGSMPPPFVAVHQEGQLAAWRLEATPRPCAESVPTGGPLFLDTHQRGEVDPPCEGEPDFGARPEPVHGPFQGQPFVPREDRPAR